MVGIFIVKKKMGKQMFKVKYKKIETRPLELTN